MYWKLFCLFGLILCLLGVLGCSDDTSDKMTDADDVDEATSFQLAPSFTLLNTELAGSQPLRLSGQSCHRRFLGDMVSTVPRGDSTLH